MNSSESRKEYGENSGELTPAERREMIQHLLQEHPRPQLFSIPVRRRVRALKMLQTKFVRSEADFFRAVHQLECKFEPKLRLLMERRKEIVNGIDEPKDEEVVYPFPNTTVCLDASIDEDTKGIPNFWFNVLRSIPIMTDLISKEDEPLLKSLSNIKSSVSMEPMSFRLEFEFNPNEYIENKTLSKTYFLKCEPDPESPFEFQGSEIYKCEADKIMWKPGRNLTVKRILKKQKHKSGSDVRTVTKTVQKRSFFNFFNVLNENDEKNVYDYEIATYLRERVIPRAVLYFTGEAFLDDSESAEDDECMENDPDEDKSSESEST